ncbi:hypothetical protein A2U01_0103128, partial [Trifolium medium]|nr:hypothetical protein [Trifolium medium]
MNGRIMAARTIGEDEL